MRYASYMTVRPRLPAFRASIALAVALVAVIPASRTDALAQSSPATSAQPPSVAAQAQATTPSLDAQPGTIPVDPRASEVVDNRIERDVRPYRAPLALWYAVALSVTWLPILASSGCRGYACMDRLAGPALRIGLAFAPPIVHWRRRRLGRGFLSLGGQIAAVAIGAGVGSAVHQAPLCGSRQSDSDDCPPEFASFLVWFIADVVWATTDVLLTPESVDMAPQRPAAFMRFVPGFTASNNRWLLTLQGEL
jgi:hypothetical protein